MKTDTVFKRAYNDTLDLIASMGGPCAVPSENQLSHQIGVSRTTVRKVLATLGEQGIVGGQGRHRHIHEAGHDHVRFPKTETVPACMQVEQRFMEWMLRDNARPGTTINELDLARKFGVATSGIREFLNRFQRFGLIEKGRNAGWVLKGFTADFAIELFEIRELFELRSANAFVGLPDASPCWQSLAALRDEHLALLAETERRYHDFSGLDRRFHLLINSATPNRFIDGFYDVIAIVFYYHYQWNKTNERRRNEAAIREHIAYIDALTSRDPSAVEHTCRAHLASAKQTLIEASFGGDASS